MMFNTEMIVKVLKGGKEDMTKKVIETVNGWYMENPKQKVELDDIVGLVKTDEPTDSVQLKKEAQLSIYEKRIIELENENEQLRKENDMFSCELSVSANKEISRNCRITELEEENKELKSTIAQLIEQNRKNNDLLLSDIRILEKALWCNGCENDYGRLKELRKEFMG